MIERELPSLRDADGVVIASMGHHRADVEALATPLADVRGLALPFLPGQERTEPLEFVFRPETCTACGRCVTVCAYGARALDGKEMALDRSYVGFADCACRYAQQTR